MSGFRPLLLQALRHLVIVLLIASGPAMADERFVFQVSYTGPFSMGKVVGVADVTLEAEAAAATIVTRVSASSERYRWVEALYPVRYRFRSWSERVNGHVVAFESYKKTSRERHRIYRRADQPSSGVVRVAADPPHDGYAGPALAEALQASTEPLFDRLGLLQRIRSESLAPGAVYDYPVTNGRREMRYRVKVERADDLVVDGRTVASWKLRIDGWRQGKRDDEIAAHRPVYLWLSHDARRVPLRADVRHPIGLFRIDLSDAAGPMAAAARS